MVHSKKLFVIVLMITSIGLGQCTRHIPDDEETDPALISDGRQVFRFDSFGDEEWWSGTLHIDKAIAGKKNGGFGPGVSPKTALAVGLKVDAEALPADVVAGIQSGAISLDDPANTITLLKLNAVVGLKGNFDVGGGLKSDWHNLRILSFHCRQFFRTRDWQTP